MRRNKSARGRVAKREIKIIPRIVFIFIASVLIAAGSYASYRFISKKVHSSDSVFALYDFWNQQNYEKVYEISGSILQNHSLHNTARAFRGYSAFYLAVSQVDNVQSLLFIDEAINNLRIALQSAKKESKPQIYYMLGQSYFYKNHFSSYFYYSDLALKYLNLAYDLGYRSDDMSMYLGLCYASLGDTQRSIEAFTEALLVRESDTLLLSIAEQYYNNNQKTSAKQYLYRVIDNTSNDDLLIRSHVLLGQIYTEEEKYDDAFMEFESILEKTENSTDAHYGLGVLYEKQGDNIKARAEFRKILRIQPNHAQAIQKMNELQK